MSAETSNDPEAVANGAEEKQPTADANHKAASESPTKPNGEPEAPSGAAESPSKKVTPKKGPAKGAQAKNEADSEKLATPKHDDADEKPQSATKSKSKESPRKAPAETASPTGATPSFTEATESGKRERRKIERFVDRTSREEEAKLRRKSELLAKAGVSLGEIERVAHFITRAEPDGLKVLHGIIYDRPGSSKELRTNLRQFRGFAFEADSQEYKSRLHRLKERHVKELKNACFALDLERNGNRDDLALRILQFLMKPVDSGRPVSKSPGKKRKSAGAKKGSKASAKKKADDDGEGEEEEEEDDKSSKSESESEEEKAAAKPRKSATTTPTATKKSVTPKAKKTDSTKKRKAQSESDSLSESDESAPPASASKKARSEKEKPKAAERNADPWEEKLTRAVESILADADLNKTTMKVVLEQIRSRFPDMEVTPERKSFVRVKVRDLIVAKSDATDADADAEIKSGSTSATNSPAKDAGRTAAADKK